MRTIKPIFILLLLTISCKHEEKKTVVPKNTVKPIIKTEEKKSNSNIRYSEEELIAFMDSVAKLPSKSLENKIAFMPDSIFRSQININKKLSSSEFSQLKGAIKSESINIKLATKVFGKFPIDTLDIHKGKMSITFFPFDEKKNSYNEFAITLGWPQEFRDCYMYFFKSNRLVSKITLHYRYDLLLEHFKDSDGKTVVYYKENYQSGSGIWWYNFYFYKYDGEKLLPVLNELENANLTWPGFRHLWLESKIVKTNPLTLKMVYRQELFDTIKEPETSWIINDSTLVQYNWNEKTKTFVGDYDRSKIKKSQILTYYLDDNELLFIKIYHKLLRQMLQKPEQKKTVLFYLNNVKKYY